MVGEFNRQFLRMSGYTDAEIDKMDPKAISTEQMQDLIRKKAMSMLGLGTSSQKIVPLFQLRDFIVQGWEYVRELPNNEAIIRLPSSF